MRPKTEWSPDRSYGLARDDDRRYVVVGLRVGAADFDGYYEVDGEQFERFMVDDSAAAAFAEECRQHRHDDRLAFGWNRSR